MQPNLKPKFSKSQLKPYIQSLLNAKPQSLVHNDSIPQNQIDKFEKSLKFLKQRPLQNFLEEEFIVRIKRQAYISQTQINNLLSAIKVQKQLFAVIKAYFSIVFDHQKSQNNFTLQNFDNFSENKNQNEKISSNSRSDSIQKEKHIERLYNQLILLSSYESQTVKILIQSLLFLKNIFEEKFIHKKLINQFERSEFTKKLEVWDIQTFKRRRRSLLKKKIKPSIYFKANEGLPQNNFVQSQQNDQIQKEKLKNTLSIVKSKIYTIAFLEYEKLETKEKLFNSHLKLLETCIREREAIINTYMEMFQEYEQITLEIIQQYQNSNFYFILLWFQLRIQFESKDKQYLILKDLKERKRLSKNMIQFLQLQKNSKSQDLLCSHKIFLKNLQNLNDQVKKRVAKQLIGIESQNLQNRLTSKANYQEVKQIIYELTLSCLNQGEGKIIGRNISGEQKLDQYMKSHDEKGKNQIQAKILQRSSSDILNHQKHLKNMSHEQIEKSRSLTVLRQNLHKNIFRQKEQTSKQKRKLSKYSGSIEKRSRSVFNLSNKNQNQSSIKSLLESPLTRQIQIYLEYQKFMKASKDSKESSPKKTDSLIKHTQSRIVNQNSKPNTDGLKLIDQIQKLNKQQNRQKKLLTNSKKKKIQTIYKAFAYNNKIVDISHWKLEEQINESQRNQFFNKNTVSTQLTQSVCDFGAGIRDLNSALDQMLAERCYMMIHYTKFWQSKTYFYRIRMSQEDGKFSLYMKMNGQSINLILPRGNNILCQRYQTIWPTIRYLLQKKMFQFSIIKFFQQIFYQKKSSQIQLNEDNSNNLANLAQGFHSQNVNFQRKISETNVNPYFEENDCSVYGQAFGEVQSDEIQELNSCFDYIHKFLGLIFAEIRKKNGRKQVICPFQETEYKKQLDQTDEQWQRNKQNLLMLYTKDFKKSYEWRKTAKFWVVLQNYEEIHLFSFLKKTNQEIFWFVSVAIDKFQILKIIQTFLISRENQNKLMKQKLAAFESQPSSKQLNFKIYWRTINKISQTYKKPSFSKMSISFRRLSMYKLGLKFIADSLISIVSNCFYHPKFIQSLKILIFNAIYIQSSVQGERLYDIDCISHEKRRMFYFVQNQPHSLTDYYKSDHIEMRKKPLVDQQKKESRKNTQHESSFIKINQEKLDQEKENEIPLINFGTNKHEIQIIQNYMDILNWHNADSQVRLNSNSKWKIVKKKIHTMITFVTHLSKKTHRKSSLLTNQKIRQNHHQFMVQEPVDTKKGEKVSPMMTTNLPKMRKSTINFLEKIENELYRVKVNFIESMTSMSEEAYLSKKWMAEIILIKDNSKQYLKFYISSADIETIFKSESNQLHNQSSNFSESYELTYVKKSSSKLQRKFSQNRVFNNFREDFNKNQSQISEEISEMDSVKFTNQSGSHYEESEERGERQNCNASIQKKNRSQNWDFTQTSFSRVKVRQIKDLKVKMFRKIVRLVTFTKIKCFSKVVISRSAEHFDPLGQNFIAEPRSSLEILHQATQNPQKIFDLKYFIPLQNCYQTIICKPVKIKFNNKTDYVIITLFKIELKNNHKMYQLRINLNKNQTYYACEIADEELRGLIDFSEKDKARQNTSISFKNDENNIFLKTLKQFNKDIQSQSQSQQAQQLMHQNYRTQLLNKSSQILISDIQNGKYFEKKRSDILQSQSRYSNFLNPNESSYILPPSSESLSKSLNENYNHLMLAMMVKVQQYSKEIFQNIFRKIQVVQKPNKDIEGQETYFGEELYLQIPQANFRKVLKLRVLERISKDMNSIYMVQIDEKTIRQLNEMVLKTSMNNNFDIFRQNIFKNTQLDTKKISYENSDNTSVKQGQSFMQIEAPQRSNHARKSFLKRTKLRSSHIQNEVNLLFESFSLYRYRQNNFQKINTMNQDNVIENMSYEVEKKYGKQVLLKFNSKKIKSYAEIFFHYFMKYLHVEEKEKKAK